MDSADQPQRTYRYSTTGWTETDARVIRETSVSLTVNGESWLTFNCTPTDLDALAVGFLFNEGIIAERSEIAAVDVCKQNTNVDVWLNHSVEKPQQWQRTSGCTGGYTSQMADPESAAVPPPAPAVARKNGSAAVVTATISPESVLASMDQMLEVQELYRETRGVHCSALSDGAVIRLRAEDIGRHNTLDKLAGHMLLDGVRVHPAIVVTTGRVSAEMLQKSARLGAVMVVSRTSPTTQSIAWAEELGITLVGYARRTQFTVYAHPERIK